MTSRRMLAVQIDGTACSGAVALEAVRQVCLGVEWRGVQDRVSDHIRRIGVGHSYVEYRGRSLHLRDGLIAVFVRCVFIEVASEDATSAEKLEGILAYWRTDDTCPGPGCVELALDKYLVEESAASELVHVIERCERRFAGFGENIPTAYWNSVREPGWYAIGEAEAGRVLDVLRRMKALIEGN